MIMCAVGLMPCQPVFCSAEKTNVENCGQTRSCQICHLLSGARHLRQQQDCPFSYSFPCHTYKTLTTQTAFTVLTGTLYGGAMHDRRKIKDC
ncbi:uncharacterized protein B0T23DRAFT_373770 [Neurospora hispaniola]|uniref:Uncharacterized protein n=1 Tax=Neurospora hispaniola TaxID=588809 RepID=A0AAJ0MU45_9PEZI|nr:hypothetical protein B0T23DRAFT_373770 [Neurospora hispaniola]